MRTILLASCGLMGTLLTATPAEALKPEEILVLTRRADPQGQTLARHYCDRRAVPRENILPLDVATGDEILWSAYQSKVVEPIRQALTRKKQVQTVRCLLLAGNWPLRVDSDPPTASEKREIDSMNAQSKRMLLEMYQSLWRIEQLANGQSPGRAPSEVPHDVRSTWDVERRYSPAVTRAAEMIARMPADRKAAMTAELTRARAPMEGLWSQIEPEPRDHSAPDFRQRHTDWCKARDEKVKPALDKLAELRKAHPSSSGREERRREAQRVGGLLGLCRQTGDDQGELTSTSRRSALDSELPLLWQDGYRLVGTLPNPLYGPGMTAAPADPNKPPLMVCRLDGYDRTQPTRMVDDAVAVEKAGLGLAGKFCIDTQGLPGSDPLRRVDEGMLQLEKWTDRPATLPVAREDSMLAIRAADANPVAFYLGWGHPDKYPGGFTCARGAITITCNPEDARNLHDSRTRGWCNGWLSAGATVVIGAVEPADVGSFPDVQMFLRGMLVDGEPLAQAYWRAARSTSGRVIVVGDPLYAPSKKTPASAPDAK